MEDSTKTIIRIVPNSIPFIMSFEDRKEAFVIAPHSEFTHMFDKGCYEFEATDDGVFKTVRIERISK